MQSRIILALLALAAGVPSASATLVGLDEVLVGNPNAIAGDNFADGIFSTPPWFVVSGSPGPEAGETLTMHNGDKIYLGFTTNPTANTVAFSLMQLTDFPTGSFAEMILYGVQENDFLSLGVSPGLAVLRDGTGATLGSVALPLSSVASLELTIVPFGHLSASVNGVSVYDEKPAQDFGEVTGLGISVVPEPATLGLLGLGCVFMGVRRRLQRTRG